MKIVNQELFTLKKYSNNKDPITDDSSLLDPGHQKGCRYCLVNRNNDTIRYFSLHDRQEDRGLISFFSSSISNSKKSKKIDLGTINM